MPPTRSPLVALTARVALTAALVATSAGAQAPARPAPTGDAWRIVALPQSSLVLARDGSVVGEIGRELRTSVSIRTLPRYVGQAFIAVEDQRFYQHDGVDVIGIAGALKDALRGEARGASTITQLLVGNMHPDVIDRRDRSLARKLREQNAAREMEKHYNKEQILEAFLNTLDFGHSWFGIESAARHYFGKGAAQLTVAEAASLASMPKSPVIYDPLRHPDKNRERRNTVLGLMAAQGYITRAQAAAAEATPVTTAPESGAIAPYFIDVVRIQAERAGVPVSQGGFRLRTTLDPELQRAAVAALAEGIAAVESRPGYRHPTPATAPAASGSRSTEYLQGLVVAMDPATGDVRALVGGRDYAASPFDRAIDAMRQPGSAFKPIVYAAAVRDSVTAATIVYDTALAVPLDGGRTYRPDNSDGKFLGPLTLRDALVHSRNPVAVQLGLNVSLDTVAALAKRFGIDAPVARVPSSAIGASAVQPLDIVRAYTVFANLGASPDPRLLLEVDDRSGRAVYAAHAPAFRTALTPGVAFIVRDMMRDVVERGTATAIRRLVPVSIPVAGKTGTTNDNSDVWFVGMTPEIVAGVWLGFDRPQQITAGAAGGSLAAPVWGRMIADYYQGRSSATWAPPAGVVAVELDRQTGLPADAATPPDRRYTEYFLDGTQPGATRFDPWSVFRYGAVGM